MYFKYDDGDVTVHNYAVKSVSTFGVGFVFSPVSSWYGFGSVGFNSVDLVNGNDGLKNGINYHLAIGYAFHSNVAIEVGYQVNTFSYYSEYEDEETNSSDTTELDFETSAFTVQSVFTF